MQDVVVEFVEDQCQYYCVCYCQYVGVLDLEVSVGLVGQWCDVQ